MSLTAIYMLGCGFTLACILESVCEYPAMGRRAARRASAALLLGVVAWPAFWLILILRR